MTLPSNNKIYFCSDHHFGINNNREQLEREKLFCSWLDTIKTDCRELFLLGDTFDFWFEYKRVVPKGFFRLFSKLSELSDMDIKIYYFLGNHDMWMKNYLKEYVGINKVFSKPETFVLNKKTFFIAHGDGLGKVPISYRIMKSFLSSKFIKSVYSFFIHPDFTMKIGQILSKASKSNHSKSKRDNTENIIINFCKTILEKKHYDYFIFGHSHNPKIISLNPKSKYINTGDWINFFSYLVLDEDEIELKYYK